MVQSFLAAGKIDESYTPEQVIIGASDVITVPGTYVAATAALAVMGKVTASGKWKLSNSAATDGSEVPLGIAVDAVTNADDTGPVYVAGEFNVDALTWHASYSTDALKLAAFGVGPIVLKKLTYSVG